MLDLQEGILREFVERAASVKPSEYDSVIKPGSPNAYVYHTCKSDGCTAPKRGRSYYCGACRRKKDLEAKRKQWHGTQKYKRRKAAAGNTAHPLR